MSDFMPSNKTIDEIVQGVTGPEGFERMREGIKEALAANPLAAPAPRLILSAPEPRATHIRVVYVGNDRHELYGTSDAELLEKERRLREMYGSR
jgi:hypothetical protein